jgi:hypothetical protein
MSTPMYVFGIRHSPLVRIPGRSRSFPSQSPT